MPDSLWSVRVRDGGVGALLVMIGSALSGCGSKPPAKPLPMVSVVTLEPRTVTVARHYVGRVDALLSADLRPQVTGTITAFFFSEGERVHRGEVLFTIDPRPYRARAAAAAARLAHARADLDKAQALLEQANEHSARYAPLAATLAIAREQYTDALVNVRVCAAQRDQARADVATAQAELMVARFEEEKTTVRSPIDGIVGSRRGGIGDLASEQDREPLAIVSQSDTVRVRFSIPDDDYLRYVRPAAGPGVPDRNLDWTLVLADETTYREPGHLYSISRAADPQTDTLEVVVLFPNREHRLRPGEFAKVQADVERRVGVLLAPASSVRLSQGVKTVSLVGPGDTVVQRTITAEERAGDAYVVTQGLAPGDRLIVGGEQKVKPGDHVTVRPASGDAGNDSAS